MCLMLSSVRISSTYGSSAPGSRTATASSRSGWRTRKPCNLRRPRVADVRPRTVSMAATRAGSSRSTAPSAASARSGQSARCTLRPPVRPRHISSTTMGASGAIVRSSTSRPVNRVSNASWSSSQNRSRWVRTYQLVSTSRCSRTDSQAPAMDRYLLARTRHLVEQVTAQMDAYDIAGACESVREHLDVLTNWYVRTQRDRFWDEDHDAFDTLLTGLEVLLRTMAPLAPMVVEEMWRGLTGGRSVHLADWPDLAEAADGAVLRDEPALVAAMDTVRAITSAALGLRKLHGLRVRQPLRELAVAVRDPGALEPYVELIRTELNIKHMTLVDLAQVTQADLGVTTRLSVNARAAGPRLGRAVQDVIRAAKAGRWTTDGDDVVVQTDAGPVALV